MYICKKNVYIYIYMLNFQVSINLIVFFIVAVNALISFKVFVLLRNCTL